MVEKKLEGAAVGAAVVAGAPHADRAIATSAITIDNFFHDVLLLDRMLKR